MFLTSFATILSHLRQQPLFGAAFLFKEVETWGTIEAILILALGAAIGWGVQRYLDKEKNG